jgi:hypothetical protein
VSSQPAERELQERERPGLPVRERLGQEPESMALQEQVLPAPGLQEQVFLLWLPVRGWALQVPGSVRQALPQELVQERQRGQRLRALLPVPAVAEPCSRPASDP